MNNRLRVTFAVPGRLDTRTGGYEYDRRIVAGLRARGWDVDISQWGDDFPFPSESARAQAARSLADLPDGAIVVIDGLAFGALPDVVRGERDRLAIVALVHHPLALETGLSPAAAAALDASERAALKSARAVVVTSEATARTLAHYDVARARITVVEPGTDAAPIAAGSRQETLTFLAVGSVVPRKGFGTLMDALALVAQRPWRLIVAGSLDRAPETVAQVMSRLHAAGLSERVEFLGELNGDALAEVYGRADVFVLPTFYEGYGMVVAEAIARGLPVISTPTGGIPSLVGDRAGLLVPIADVPALAHALAQVIDDPATLDRLRHGARDARERLVSWDDRAGEWAAILRAVARERA